MDRKDSETLRMLVTGGAGFIGSAIVRDAVSTGHDVVAVDDFSIGHQDAMPAGVSVAEVDLSCQRDVDRLFQEVRPHVVSHHAAQSSVAGSLEQPQIDISSNYEALINILDAASRVSADHLIFASSCSVYGECLEPADENQPTFPQSPYAISKLAGEGYVKYYQRCHGLNSTILRYGNVYGPGQSTNRGCGVVAMFADRILHGRPVQVFGNGRSIRDYVHIDDVVNAHSRVVKSFVPDSCSVLNVGTGIGTTPLQLIEWIRQLTGSEFSDEPAVEYLPTRIGETTASLLSPERAKRSFNWRPSIDIRSGIETVVDWLVPTRVPQ